jgi:2-methylcitrate dehydratase PrpD
MPDSALEPFLPARVAIVEVTLRDGTRLTDRVDAVRGTVRNPMTREEIVDKARDLIAPVLGAAQGQALIHAVLALDQAGDLTSLRPLLQRA